jgi:hypothetical protein
MSARISEPRKWNNVQASFVQMIALGFEAGIVASRILRSAPDSPGADRGDYAAFDLNWRKKLFFTNVYHIFPVDSASCPKSGKCST